MQNAIPGAESAEWPRLNFDTILVRQSERGYNLLSLDEFLALPVDIRIEMILDRRVRFVNGEDEVSPYAALESLERYRKAIV